MTDVRKPNPEFSDATRGEVQAVTLTPPPAEVTACTTIPEAGPCGFEFDINSIPDMARRG